MRLLPTRLLVVAILLTFSARSAPAQDRAGARREVVRWEYAELSYRTLPARPAGKDADGNDVPGKESSTSLRWTTGADDLTVNGWGELAVKLNVAFKKDASPVSQRIQVLNALGAAGWELVESQSTGPTAAIVSGGRGNQPGFGNLPGNFGQGASVSRAAGTMLFKRRT